MELTGELKDKISKCETREQVKDQFKEAGLILSDEELDGISGGILQRKPPMGSTKKDKRP